MSSELFGIFIEFTELVVVGIAAPERIERPLFTWGD